MKSLFGEVTRKPKKKRQFSKYTQYKTNLGGRDIKVQGYEPQALKYLTEKLGISPDDIRCEEEFGDALNIRYKYGGKMRTYYPDIYVVSKRLIVEVKSSHTLGLYHKKKRGWSMTCAKAIACRKKGYKFMLLLMDQRGNRIRLPKNWPYMKKEECLALVEEMNPREELAGLLTL